MSREDSKFGWSYPPGCSSVPGDEPCWCEICRQYDDNCVCPECPRCGDIGNPDCCKEVDLGICGELYGKETVAQQIAWQEYTVAELRQEWMEASQVLDYLRSKIVDEGGE